MDEDAAKDPAQEQEWLRQNNLAYGGLIGIGVVMVQPFLTTSSLDLSALVCVVAFALSIPLLAALVMVNLQESFRRHASRSRLVFIAKPVAQASGFIGVVAGFWHVSWIAGVVMLASGVAGVAVHSAGYVHLERDRRRASRGGGAPGE
jgi:hypothetical protein